MGSIWRNREFRRYMAATISIGLVFVILSFWINLTAGLLALAMFIVLVLSSYCFTRNQYRQIHRLSAQLAKIVAGDYQVDIGEYAEGELSILSSEILKITSTLSHQAQSLQRDKAFLADSLADISHQLKTPLTSMSMMADLLETPNLPEEKKAEFLHGIRIGLDRTGWLITALLKLSRLDAGAVIFQMDHVPLKAIIEKALSPLLIPAELKNQMISTQIENNIFIYTDKHWLAETIGNLLKNCLEHTQEGGQIEILCNQNPLYTEIQVRDNGPGISKEDLPRIFDRFFRGNNASAESVGIGLALSKSIVQNLGGTLSAENRSQGGAAFIIKLYGKTVV